MFSPSSLYVTISRNKIAVRNIDTGETVSGAADFSTERLLVGTFTVADELLTSLTSKVRGRVWRRLWILIHHADHFEGELSEVEERIMLELAAGIGAAKTVIWSGRDLSNEEVRQRLQ